MRITAEQFTTAMEQMPLPAASIRRLLTTHFHAPGRVATMTMLAKAAGWNDNDPANLHYGTLAKRIRERLAASRLNVERPEEGDDQLYLLAEFVRPNLQTTNAECLLVMRPEFASALECVGWLASDVSE